MKKIKLIDVVVPEIVAYLKYGEEKVPDYRCPKCGFGVADDYICCPHCSAELNWEDVEELSEEMFRNLTSTGTYDSDFTLEEIEEQTKEHFKRMLEELSKTDIGKDTNVLSKTDIQLRKAV